MRSSLYLMTSKTRNNFYLIFLIFIPSSTDSLIFSYKTEIEREKVIPYFSFLFVRRERVRVSSSEKCSIADPGCLSRIQSQKDSASISKNLSFF